MIGDININIRSTDNNVQEYLDILADQGFNSDINNITREQSTSCIDHIFVKHNSRTLEVNAKIFRYLISDHWPSCLNIILESKVKYNQDNNELNKYSINISWPRFQMHLINYNKL